MIYALPVGVIVGQDQLSAVHVGGLFLRAYLGGVAAGVVTTCALIPVRRRLEGPLLGNVSMLQQSVAFWGLAGFRGAVSLAAALAVPEAHLPENTGVVEERQLANGLSPRRRSPRCRWSPRSSAPTRMSSTG